MARLSLSSIRTGCRAASTLSKMGEFKGAKKSVAVIGTGPAGAITVDALAQEKCFDTIRVFERRQKAGGLW